MNTAPILRPGDQIHLALPFGNRDDSELIGASMTAKYRELGIIVHTIDWVSGLNTPYVVSVVRGVRRG